MGKSEGRGGGGQGEGGQSEEGVALKEERNNDQRMPIVGRG